jgi:hypothetical protein
MLVRMSQVAMESWMRELDWLYIVKGMVIIESIQLKRPLGSGFKSADLMNSILEGLGSGKARLCKT